MPEHRNETPVKQTIVCFPYAIAVIFSAWQVLYAILTALAFILLLINSCILSHTGMVICVPVQKLIQ